MKHLVITQDGELEYRTAGNPRKAVGPEGPARVRLDPVQPMTGWVNDCGFLYPEKYHRNVVGGTVLMLLGARQQPYAGPVVFTGWRDCSVHGSETTGLQREVVGFLIELHQDVRLALDGLAPVGPIQREHVSAVQALADIVRDAEPPAIQITEVSVGEALGRLWGGLLS